MKILLLEKTFKASEIANLLKNLLDAIKDLDVEIYLFTSADSKPYLPKLDKIVGVQFFENYYHTRLLEYEAVKLHKTFPFEKLISLREFDLLRAARIRQYLSLPSLEPENIELFRDKFLMKNQAKKAGLKVPRFKKVDYVVDLLAFLDEVNYPVIIKPRNMAGGMGFQIIKNAEDLEKVIKLMSTTTDFDAPLNMIAEEYIAAEMANVDGLIHKGKIVAISAAEYIGLQWQSGFSVDNYYANKQYGTLSIEHGSDKEKKLLNYTKKLLQKFNKTSTYSFHAELWIDKDNTVSLNEVAARTGGFWVYNLVHTLFNPGLEPSLFRYLCTEDESIFKSIKHHAKPYAFSGIIPVIPGTVVSIPETLPLSKPELYRCGLKPGDKIEHPTGFYDHLGLMVTLGNSPAQCLERFDLALKEFREKVVITK